MKYITKPKLAETSDLPHLYAWKQQGVFDGVPPGVIQVDVKGAQS